MSGSSLGKWAVGGISILWMGWATWNQFGNLSDSDVETHSSPVVQERMKECTGTFKQRYNCKENIVIASGRDTFNNMVGRIAVIVVPPLLLLAGRHMVLRRRLEDENPSDDLLQEHHHRRHRRHSTTRH